MKPKSLSFVILLLLIIGLIFISVSSLAEAAYTTSDKLFFIKKQLIWSVLGIVTYFVASRINLNLIKTYANLFFYISLCLLGTLLLPQFGNIILGAKRWLDFGLISIQPSEIFKISAIIFFSKLFSESANVNIKKLIYFLGVPLILIILEPNMSTAVLVATIIITIYYIAGGEILPLFSACLIGLLISIILIFSSPYRKARLDSASYHSNQMIIALTSGHIIGKGFANSDQKYRYIPKVSTDSILAVIGEEIGFIGTTSLIFIYVYLVLSLLKIGQLTDDRFYKLFIIGIACWLSYQSIINISAVVALIPLTGVPLPLISYGGSSLITLLFGLGIVENINQHSTKLVYSTKHDQKQDHYHHRHPPHSGH